MFVTVIFAKEEWGVLKEVYENAEMVEPQVCPTVLFTCL